MAPMQYSLTPDTGATTKRARVHEYVFPVSTLWMAKRSPAVAGLLVYAL